MTTETVIAPEETFSDAVEIATLKSPVLSPSRESVDSMASQSYIEVKTQENVDAEDDEHDATHLVLENLKLIKRIDEISKKLKKTEKKLQNALKDRPTEDALSTSPRATSISSRSEDTISEEPMSPRASVDEGFATTTTTPVPETADGAPIDPLDLENSLVPKLQRRSTRIMSSKDVESAIKEIERLRAEVKHLNERLVDEVERRAELEHSKSLLIQETEELSTEVFQEAHRMVIEEKVAKDSAERRIDAFERRLAEMNDIIAADKEEIKALKQFIQDVVEEKEKQKQADAVYVVETPMKKADSQETLVAAEDAIENKPETVEPAAPAQEVNRKGKRNRNKSNRKTPTPASPTTKEEETEQVPKVIEEPSEGDVSLETIEAVFDESKQDSSSPKSENKVIPSSQQLSPSICILGNPIGLESISKPGDISSRLFHQGRCYFHPKDVNFMELNSLLRSDKFAEIASSKFIRKIVSEEVNPCLTFESSTLGFVLKHRIAKAIRNQIVALHKYTPRTLKYEEAYVSASTCTCFLCDKPVVVSADEPFWRMEFNDGNEVISQVSSQFTVASGQIMKFWNRSSSSAAADKKEEQSSPQIDMQDMETVSSSDRASPVPSTISGTEITAATTTTDTNQINELICMFCRDKVVQVCEFQSFSKMIENGYVSKMEPELVYAKLCALREGLFFAKAGLVRYD